MKPPHYNGTFDDSWFGKQRKRLAQMVECAAPTPWRIDKDNAEGIEIVADNGDLVFTESWGDLPSERGVGFAEQIISQSRANAYLIVDAVNYTALVRTRSLPNAKQSAAAHKLQEVTIEIEPIEGSDKYDVHFNSHQLGRETFAYRTKKQIAVLVAGRLVNAFQDIRLGAAQNERENDEPKRMS